MSSKGKRTPCPHGCGATLDRHQRKGHERIRCPIATKPIQRQCANTKGGCATIITLKPSSPDQQMCSKRCWNQMRATEYVSLKGEKMKLRRTTGPTAEERQMAIFGRRERALEAEAHAAAALCLPPERSYTLWGALLGINMEGT